MERETYKYLKLRRNYQAIISKDQFINFISTSYRETVMIFHESVLCSEFQFCLGPVVNEESQVAFRVVHQAHWRAFTVGIIANTALVGCVSLPDSLVASQLF